MVLQYRSSSNRVASPGSDVRLLLIKENVKQSRRNMAQTPLRWYRRPEVWGLSPCGHPGKSTTATTSTTTIYWYHLTKQPTQHSPGRGFLASSGQEYDIDSGLAAVAARLVMLIWWRWCCLLLRHLVAFGHTPNMVWYDMVWYDMIWCATGYGASRGTASAEGKQKMKM